ncbi:MAG: heme o synthase [Deltaproteobacteria bacterium]|nr:heme o synthase [Deltaproteobacteria bacterium]MCW5800998.1 heme o synthase [Deltaproteobacteria bacterium]
MNAPVRSIPAVVDLVALMKPRIMVMALLTAAGAASLAPGTVPAPTLAWLLLGTALVVGAANTLNMWLERDVDCLMARTRMRPLPQGRLAASTALAFGAVQGVLAVPALLVVNVPTAALGMAALLLYVGVYTPMKARSHLATWVGSVPGAMPALMGWTAATGRIELGGLAVFGVLFFWQVPHFHAIAMYRQRDYEAAGLKTLPGARGVAAARHEIALYLIVQVAISLSLYPLGVAGLPYLVTAGVLGIGVLLQGLGGMRNGGSKWARDVFLASIVYLPVLFAVMVLDGRA